jgi:hypothetical protein
LVTLGAVAEKRYAALETSSSSSSIVLVEY